MPEQCSSCKLPILSISEQTRVPFFKADSDAAKKLLTYIKEAKKGIRTYIDSGNGER